jgi:mRNA interferase MazF
VLLTAGATGLPRDSVANVSQVVTLYRSLLLDRAGTLPRATLGLVLAGMDVMLGR